MRYINIDKTIVRRWPRVPKPKIITNVWHWRFGGLYFYSGPGAWAWRLIFSFWAWRLSWKPCWEGSVLALFLRFSGSRGLKSLALLGPPWASASRATDKPEASKDSGDTLSSDLCPPPPSPPAPPPPLPLPLPPSLPSPPPPPPCPFPRRRLPTITITTTTGPTLPVPLPFPSHHHHHLSKSPKHIQPQLGYRNIDMQ